MKNPDLIRKIRGDVDLNLMELEELNILKEKIKDKKEFELKSRYLMAGIPFVYWDVELKSFAGEDDKTRELVGLYCAHLAFALESGQGIIFTGAHGTGKTSLACIIGKEAIKAGYTVKYLAVAKLLSMIMESFDSKDLKEKLDLVLERVEFLILDDLGKEYKGYKEQLTPMMSMRLDSMLRERVNRSLITIGTTNYNIKVIAQTYGESVLSIIHGSCRVCEVNGKDIRLFKGEHFWDELKKKV